MIHFIFNSHVIAKKGNMRQIFWKIEEVREKGRNPKIGIFHEIRKNGKNEEIFFGKSRRLECRVETVKIGYFM